MPQAKLCLGVLCEQRQSLSGFADRNYASTPNVDDVLFCQNLISNGHRILSTDIPQVECPFLHFVGVFHPDQAACTTFAIVWAPDAGTERDFCLESWVNPDFIVINTPLDGLVAPLFLRFFC